jgi:glycosyltransferase involved in cell wall biosynthesis
MSFCTDIDVLILTYNEALNIGRGIDALRSFPEIVVLDSGSTDETTEIALSRSNVRVVKRLFDGHANQWNFGLTECGLRRPWVLALDADYLVPEKLVGEIASLAPPQDVSGYRISFRYCVVGRPLRATLYPPVVALFRRERCHYEQFGHTQRLVVNGRVLELTHRIDHDDRKPLSRWLSSQQKYAALEATYLRTTSKENLRKSDHIRLMAWPAPILVFLYTLVVKRCLWDGWPGWFYVLQRTLAEIIIALEILENRSKREV